MKKLLLTLLFFLFTLLLFPQPTYANNLTYQCGSGKTITFSQNPLYLDQQQPDYVTFTVEGDMSTGSEYRLEFTDSWDFTSKQTYLGNPLVFQEEFDLPNDVQVILVLDLGWDKNNQEICRVTEPLVIYATTPSDTCNVTFTPNPADLNDSVNMDVKDLESLQSYNLEIHHKGSLYNETIFSILTNNQGSITTNIPSLNKTGSYKLVIFKEYTKVCETDYILTIQENIQEPTCYPTEETCIAAGCVCIESNPYKKDKKECRDSENTSEVCTNSIPTPSMIPGPETCPTSDGSIGIQTAIGCIPTGIGAFTDTILTRGISIGAGLAFLLILYGAFVLITSAGNPENTKKGGEIITSALVGLLFIIFSVFLLRLIGVDILKIPGFSSNSNQKQEIAINKL
ncbi:MAG: pilin [Patescibacteria group bacterium]|nr:pilin [Patescibacteria group bacterium]